MCAAKASPASDDDDAQFTQGYNDMIKRVKDNRSAMRSKITKSHAAKHENLRKRIISLKRHVSRDQLGRDDARSLDKQTGLGALRNLLDRKTDIESRIATCMQSLETALITTSREIQLTLRKRAEATRDTHVANP